jgi:hypothetical protein
VKAIIAKAESLYNICDFEHALLLFTRALYLAPESSLVQTGILKCKKTISNKLCDGDIFFFTGSKYFIDHLRREGKEGVGAYLNGEEQSFRAVSSLTAIKQNMMRLKVNQEKDEKKKIVRKDRMKADKMFLKNLKKTIQPIGGMKKDVVRYTVTDLLF